MPEKAKGNYITEDDVDNWGLAISATAGFVPDNVDTTTEQITVGLDIPTGSKIRFSSTGVLPGGLEADIIYYAIKISTTDSITIIQVARSPVNAAAETPVAIDITSLGVGTHTIDVGEGETLADRQAVIDEVEAQVERITKDYFYPKTFYDFLDGNGRDRLFLPIRQKILSINYMAISQVEVSTIDKTGTDITSASLFVNDDKANNKAFTDGVGDWKVTSTGGATFASSTGGETDNGGKYTFDDSGVTTILTLDDKDGTVLKYLEVGKKYGITIYAKKGANWTGGKITIKCDGQSKELPDLTAEFVKTVFDFTANGIDATITIDCATPAADDELWIDTLEFVQYTGIAGRYTATLTISTTADYYKGNYLGIKDASERVNNLWGSRILGNTATDPVTKKSVFTLEQPLKATLVEEDVVSIITNWNWDNDCIYRSPLGITRELGALMEPSEFFLNGYFPKGHGNIEVKGTIGHYSCPEAIKNACIILARDENDPTLYEHYEFEKESMGRVYSYDRGGEEYLSGIIECDRYLKRYVNRKPILVA